METFSFLSFFSLCYLNGLKITLSVVLYSLSLNRLKSYSFSVIKAESSFYHLCYVTIALKNIEVSVTANQFLQF